jgi:diphosphomevalonate decarboxylase
MLADRFKDISFEQAWQGEAEAHANIALVKYWGKKAHQLPINPSLSFTLKECKTQMKMEITKSDQLHVDLSFAGHANDQFAQKIQAFLSTLINDIPVLKKLKFNIQTSNTFPHSSGIASSASSMAVLAKLLSELLFQCTGEPLDLKIVSYLARLASGSACRSVYPGFVSWGENPWLEGSSDLYAQDISSWIHPKFRQLNDAIVVVANEAKEVSSSKGHQLMKGHPFLDARSFQAKENYRLMLLALQDGDFDRVGELMEVEALTLHAMMMTSNPGYMLLAPASLQVIDLVRKFRALTGKSLYFTIDAGPNIHLIYHDQDRVVIDEFINNKIKPLSVNQDFIIWDRVGL